MTTWSVEAGQGLFEIVHCKVYDIPAVPLNVVVGLDALLNEPPEPLIMLHAPVPSVAALAARVTVVRPQVDVPVWSGPALAVVGAAITVIFAVLLALIVLLQAPDASFVTVNMVTPLLASAEVVKVPVPAELTVMVAVLPVAVLGVLRL